MSSQALPAERVLTYIGLRSALRPLIVLENIAMMRNLEEVTIVTGDYSSISALLSERSLPNFVRESRETRRKTGER